MNNIFGVVNGYDVNGTCLGLTVNWSMHILCIMFLFDIQYKNKLEYVG